MDQFVQESERDLQEKSRKAQNTASGINKNETKVIKGGEAWMEKDVNVEAVRLGEMKTRTRERRRRRLLSNRKIQGS